MLHYSSVGARCSRAWCDVTPTSAALALKGIDYEYRAVHLLKDGGEQVLHLSLYCILHVLVSVFPPS